MNRSMAKRMILAALSIMCCVFSIGYSREIYALMTGPFIEDPEKIIVDGADFTPVAELAVSGANGFIILFSFGSYVMITTIFALISALLSRIFIIRKNYNVTLSDIKFSKWFIIISSVFAFIAGIIMTGIKFIPYAAALSWQQPLFMFLIYYLPLKRKFNEFLKTD